MKRGINESIAFASNILYDFAIVPSSYHCSARRFDFVLVHSFSNSCTRALLNALRRCVYNNVERKNVSSTRPVQREGANIYFENYRLHRIRNGIVMPYRDDLGVDGHRAVVTVDTGVDVVGSRRGSCVKRRMKRQEAGGAAIAAHRRWWCHLTPVIIVQHPAKIKRECVQLYSMSCHLLDQINNFSLNLNG